MKRLERIDEEARTAAVGGREGRQTKAQGAPAAVDAHTCEGGGR